MLHYKLGMYNLTTLPTHNTAKLTLHSDTDDTIPTLQQIPELLKELPCTLQAHARQFPRPPNCAPSHQTDSPQPNPAPSLCPAEAA
jgi:hypothetical protein